MSMLDQLLILGRSIPRLEAVIVGEGEDHRSSVRPFAFDDGWLVVSCDNLALVLLPDLEEAVSVGLVGIVVVDGDECDEVDGHLLLCSD